MNSKKKAMSSGPAPFSEFGKHARDMLTRDYNYNQKFSLSFPTTTGTGFIATGIVKDQIFAGDISTLYKNGMTAINVKVDTYSNVTTTVTYDVLPGTKATITFNVPYNKSENISTKVTYGVLPRTKATISFKVPDNKFGKLDVHYIHQHAAINSSIGLNPSPLVEVAAAIGSKDVAIGGEIGFDTSSSSFTKCNAGINFNKPDFSAALILTDKGRTVNVSYVHSMNPLTGTEVAAEMTHRLSGFGNNSFSIGSVHKVGPLTLVKTRFSDNGKVAILSRREWRPNSLVTVSAEYDTKAINVAPKFGLAIALKP